MSKPRRWMSRREWIKAAGATAAAVSAPTIVPASVFGADAPNNALNIAGIGIGGQGGSVVRKMAELGCRIGALCDVDGKHAARTFEQYPDAEVFTDYRDLLAKRKDIDAVVIGTPDHMHAPITLAALRAGRHVYVEKPMSHTIEEARVMRNVAEETGLVTQMGNAGHAGHGIRLTKEWIAAGAIGRVREVHCWSDRPGKFWTQNLDRPAETVPVPDTLDWDLWLGAAPQRPYHPVYAPRAWRGWFDFGTGALGDMAVHNLDPAFYALDLGAPTSVEAQTSPLKKESYPEWQIITYRFAAAGERPAIDVVWYDGGKLPPRPAHYPAEYDIKDNGIIFIGDRGTIVCGGWAGTPSLWPEARRESFQRPEPTIARSPGHHQEWIAACKAGDPTMAKAGFAYSGPFTEALLVGNLAARLGKPIEWDGESMRATNAPDADPLIRKPYRPGFGLDA